MEKKQPGVLMHRKNQKTLLEKGFSNPDDIELDHPEEFGNCADGNGLIQVHAAKLPKKILFGSIGLRISTGLPLQIFKLLNTFVRMTFLKFFIPTF